MIKTNGDIGTDKYYLIDFSFFGNQLIDLSSARALSGTLSTHVRRKARGLTGEMKPSGRFREDSTPSL